MDILKGMQIAGTLDPTLSRTGEMGGADLDRATGSSPQYIRMVVHDNRYRHSLPAAKCQKVLDHCAGYAS